VACGSLAACSTQEVTPPGTSPPTIPSAATIDTLSVAMTNGVVSAIPAGKTTKARGSTLSYSFQAATGFRNVLVLLDGTAVPANGSVTFNKTRTLVAAADSILPQSTSEVALSASISSIAALRDGARLQQSLQEILDSLLNSQTESDPVKRYQLALASSLVPERDASLLNSLTSPNSALRERSSSRNITSNAEDEAHTVFLYVNGIWSPEFNARLVSRGAVTPLARRRGLGEAQGFAFSYVWNRTASEQSQEVQGFQNCLSLKVNQFFAGMNSAMLTASNCIPPDGLIVAGLRQTGATTDY